MSQEIISLQHKFIVCPWFSRFCPARRTRVSLPLWAFAGYLFGLPLLSASAQGATQEPSVAPPTLLVAVDHIIWRWAHCSVGSESGGWKSTDKAKVSDWLR
jgi:hypothetical protein